TVRGNFTYAKNVVQNWEQAYLEYPYLEFNGYPHEAIRGFQAIGLFKDEDDIKYSPRQTFGNVMPGDIKYKDVNGDGVINDLDKVPLTHSNYPLTMYGFGGEFRYKNLTLGILFKGTGKTPFFYVGQPMRHRVDNDWESWDGTNQTITNGMGYMRSEEHTSELQSRENLVCRLLLPLTSTLFPYTTLFRSYPLTMYGFGGEFRYKNLTLGILFKGTGKTPFFYVGQPMRHRVDNDWESWDGTNQTITNGMGYM